MDINIPIAPAPRVPFVIPQDGTAMNDNQFCLTVIGILVERLGGRVAFTQEDFDAVAGTVLLEGFNKQTGAFIVANARPVQEAP